MAVSVAVLASGSKGNCAVVRSERAAILVDAGLSCRETCRRMAQVGLDAAALSAIVITHEHSDHVNGLPMLAKKLRIPVFMTERTARTWQRQLDDANVAAPVLARHETFAAGRGFTIGDIEVRSFTIPHDAADPVGFSFQAEGVKVGIVTDLGYIPPNVRHELRGADVLVIESNHDLEMLRVGPYPWMVKQRVMSRVGHLSNDALAEFFTSDYDGRAAFVVLAHLSEQNNLPELARRAAEQALGPRADLLHNQLLLARQDAPLAPLFL